MEDMVRTLSVLPFNYFLCKVMHLLIISLFQQSLTFYEEIYIYIIFKCFKSRKRSVNILPLLYFCYS